MEVKDWPRVCYRKGGYLMWEGLGLGFAMSLGKYLMGEGPITAKATLRRTTARLPYLRGVGLGLQPAKAHSILGGDWCMELAGEDQHKQGGCMTLGSGEHGWAN